MVKKKYTKLIKILLALLLASIMSAAFAFSETHVPVLLYHHILEESENSEYSDNKSTISKESFEAQMKYLHDNGYTAISQQELHKFLYDNVPLAKKSVMITFDDGYLSNLIYAYPIMKQYGLTGTIFVITKNMPDESQTFDPHKLQFLSKSQIDEMRDLFDFGSHTNDLHYIHNSESDFITKNSAVVLQDLTESTTKLPATSFAYPFGQYSHRGIRLLKQSGFDLCYTTKKGFVTNFSNPYTLKRFSVKRDTSFEEFTTFLTTGK